MKRIAMMTMGMMVAMSLQVMAQGFGGDRWDRDQETEFIREAAQGGMMEVQLGKMAQQQASSQQVRDFGAMMERDHSDANSQLKQVAQQLQVDLSSSLDQEHQSKVQELSGLSGDEFDEKYMQMMVEDHKKDVSKFEKAQKGVSNEQLQGWVDNTLPVLKQHLDRAKSVNGQL